MRAPMFARSAFAAALLASVSSAAAQTAGPDADSRALLGIEVSMSGTSRDTVGVLVSSVAPEARPRAPVFRSVSESPRSMA